MDDQKILNFWIWDLVFNFHIPAFVGHEFYALVYDFKSKKVECVCVCVLCKLLVWCKRWRVNRMRDFCHLVSGLTSPQV